MSSIGGGGGGGGEAGRGGIISGIAHCDHSLGCRFVLSNCWYESYLRAVE